MSSANAIVQGQNALPLTEETTRALVELQGKELDLRLRELKQRSVEEQHNYEYAQKMLEAQKTDLSEERIHGIARQKNMYMFWGCVLLLVICFFGYALHLGAGELVGSILEKAVYYIAGALSSYGYCKYKKDGQ